LAAEALRTPAHIGYAETCFAALERLLRGKVKEIAQVPTTLRFVGIEMVTGDQ
jgi:hypothetical protein